MSYNIEVTEEDDESLLAAVNAGQSEHADQCGIDLTRHPISCAIHDETGQLIAGLTSNVLGPYFHVARLWVAEPHRGTGLGRSLMQAAEHRAIEKGAVLAYLSTFGFQAPHIYERLGYTTFATLEGRTADETRYFIKKPLHTTDADGPAD